MAVDVAEPVDEAEAVAVVGSAAEDAVDAVAVVSVPEA